MDGGRHVLGEFWLQYDVVVEMLFQVLCALVAAVAVVDSEDLDFGPEIVGEFGLLGDWLDHVEDDGDSILVCFSDQADVGVRSEGTDDAEFLVGCLGILEKWKLRGRPNTRHSHRLIKLHFLLLLYLFGRILPVLWRYAAMPITCLTLDTIPPRNGVGMTVPLILEILRVMQVTSL